MDACEPQLLSAFVDDELESSVRERLAAHVAQCPRCAAEVAELQKLSASIRAYHFDDLRESERIALHAALDERVDAPIWRLGGALGLIAASILVVAGTWLAALPAPSATPTSGQTVVQANPEPWESVAMTLRVDVPDVNNAHFDEWMLTQLASADWSHP